MLLDFDPTVIAIGSQPFWLRWSEGSGRPVARRHRDRAPCHADVVQPVGVAVIDSPRTPGDYRPLLYRPAWRREAARLRPEAMTPARLSSLRGMALQCSRTHDQDVQGLKVVSRHQPGLPRSPGAITGATGCRVGCPLSRRPLNAEGGRIHTCPVSTDSADVLAAVLMTLTEVFLRESLRGSGITPTHPRPAPG
jgi:hypothetical protein